MIHKSTLATTIAIGLALGGSASAQHPPVNTYPPAGTNYEAWPVAAPADSQRICSNVLAQYPADHLQIEAPGLRIDCNPSSPMHRVVLTFRHATDVSWYRSHAGHRTIVEGETDQD